MVDGELADCVVMWYHVITALRSRSWDLLLLRGVARPLTSDIASAFNLVLTSAGSSGCRTCQEEDGRGAPENAILRSAPTEHAPSSHDFALRQYARVRFESKFGLQVGYDSLDSDSDGLLACLH